MNRNIKIVGVNIDGQFGGRVLINQNLNTAGETSVRLSNVEFKGMGQFGYSDPDDPRFSLAIVGVTSFATVTGCVFRDSFSTAIGAIHSFNVNLQSNVVVRPIGDGIRIAGVGTGNKLEANIVINVVHPLLETQVEVDFCVITRFRIEISILAYPYNLF